MLAPYFVTTKKNTILVIPRLILDDKNYITIIHVTLLHFWKRHHVLYNICSYHPTLYT